MNKSCLIILILTLLSFDLQNLVYAETAPCNTQEIIPKVIANLDKSTCKIALKSEACKEVPKADLRECTSDPKINQGPSVWGFIKGCAVGAFDSAKDILSFLWKILTWVWDNSTSAEARNNTDGKLTEYGQMTKLYLHNEYAKSYEKSSAPLRHMEAVQRMNGVIAKLLMDKVNEAISDTRAEFSCLNFEAKTKMTCKYIGDVFLPPTGALVLLKYGPKALKTSLSVLKSALKAPVIRKPIYRTMAIRASYVGETTGKVFGTKVKYFSKFKRSRLKVTVNADGKLLDASGNLLNVKKGMYVMDETGQIFVSAEHVSGKIHHSSILAGEPVAGAGMISIENGVVKYIDRASGHYRPSPEAYKQVIKQLESEGVRLGEGVVKSKGY